MNKLKITYLEELPFLIEMLKNANSPLIYDWQKSFNPARTYITSIDFEEVQILFSGTYWKEATRLFQVFCLEYGERLTLQRFMWLAEHTTIMNHSLLGDSEFNHYIKENGGYLEVTEFEKNNILLNCHGEDFELHYNHRDIEMVQRLGMEILPTKYQFRSKNGYYLPINIHIRYNDVLTKWMRRGGKNRNRYQVTHTPELVIEGVSKNAVFDLAVYLYKQEGLSSLITQWAVDPNKTEYKIKIKYTEVLVRDSWKEENPEYVSTARELSVLSEYDLESFKVQDILKHSTYDTYGIALGYEHYQKLNLSPEKVVGDKVPLGDNRYGYVEGALGSGVPISVNAGGIRIKTPYYYVEMGKYKDVLLPLVNNKSYTSYVHKNRYDDADIRLVLEKGAKYATTDFTEDVIEVEESNKSKIPLDKYPKVDFSRLKLEELGLDFTEGLHLNRTRLTDTYDDFKYVPYILSVEGKDTQLIVEYVDGDIVKFSTTDADYRARVVFKDRVGVTLRPEIKSLSELVMSLSTDTLEGLSGVDLESNGEEFGDLLSEWLRYRETKDSFRVWDEVKKISIGLRSKGELEEYDIDIFEDIHLI